MSQESMTDRQAAAEQFRWQGRSCIEMGSPLYGRLCGEIAADIDRGGPVWQVLREHGGSLRDFGLGLRTLAALHQLVLEDRAPELARFYPSAGGTGDNAIWPAFAAQFEQQPGAIAELLQLPVQTNEVGRSAAMLGGFLDVARNTGLPLRLLEIGASAGLNLRWDRYLYSDGERQWGDPRSNVRLNFEPGQGPPLDTDVVIGSRRGCDAQPLDPASEQDRLRLKACVWPDQTWRFDALSAALDEAVRSPVLVEQADAADWLEEALTDSAPKTATIVFHSVVFFYLDESRRARIKRAIESFGNDTTKHRPLAWLRLEAGESGGAEVRLTTWPGGQERLVATAGYQGPPVKWLVRD